MINHRDLREMDKFPDEWATALAEYAPKTFNAVVTHYLDMIDEDFPVPGTPGRHIEDTPPL